MTRIVIADDHPLVRGALRQAVENTIAQVMTSYYTVVEQNVLLGAQRTALGLSRERLTIAEAKSRMLASLIDEAMAINGSAPGRANPTPEVVIGMTCEAPEARLIWVPPSVAASAAGPPSEMRNVSAVSPVFVTVN